MAKKTQYIHSQILGLSGDPMVLPNTAVAEIINYVDPTPVKDAPDWLLGTLDWRGYRIPLLSIENAMGEGTQELASDSRIAILNCVGGRKTFSFYAIVTKGLPRLVNIDEKIISPIVDGVKNKLVSSSVMLNQVKAIIPDLEEIESMVSKTGVRNSRAS